MLAELVREGRLPPVAQRTGPEPVVMEGVDGIGSTHDGGRAVTAPVKDDGDSHLEGGALDAQRCPGVRERVETPTDELLLVAGGDDHVDSAQTAHRRGSGQWSGAAWTTISTSRSR